MSLAADIVRVLLNSLQTGSIYVLLAVGLSIILGTLKFVNFAHGALYLIGAYAGILIAGEMSLSNGKLQEWGMSTIGLNLGYAAALVLVPVLVFVIGLLMERFVARPFYDRPDTDQILVTFGLAVIVQELFRALFGGNSQEFSQPEWASGPVALPVVGNFPEWRLWVIAITAILVLLVIGLIEYTDFGLIVRAGTLDSEMVRLLGVKLDRQYLIVFGIGAALAGVAGVVGGPLELVNPNVGTGILVPAFITVVIGGVGSTRGAVAGGLLLGFVESTLIALPSVSLGFLPIIDSFTLNFAPWSQVGMYALAAVVLLVRPQGLFGKEVEA